MPSSPHVHLADRCRCIGTEASCPDKFTASMNLDWVLLVSGQITVTKYFSHYFIAGQITVTKYISHYFVRVSRRRVGRNSVKVRLVTVSQYLAQLWFYSNATLFLMNNSVLTMSLWSRSIHVLRHCSCYFFISHNIYHYFAESKPPLEPSIVSLYPHRVLAVFSCPHIVLTVP